MNESLIKLINLYNIVFIAKKFILITAILVNGMYFVFNAYIEFGSNDTGEFGDAVSFLGAKMLRNMEENPIETLLYSSLSIFILLIIVITSSLFFSKNKELKCNSFFIKTRLNEVKKTYSIPRWVKCKVHRNSTFVYLNSLYISIQDLINIGDDRTNFILHHEAFHLRSLDSMLGVIEKSLSIICSFHMAAYLSGEVEKIIASQNTVYNFIIIIGSFSMTFLPSLYMEFTYTRFKEYICDFYAFKKTKIQVHFLGLNNKMKFSLLHPSDAARGKYINGKRWLVKTAVLLYEVTLYSILFYLFFNNEILESIIHLLLLLFFVNMAVSLRIFYLA